MRDTGNQEGYEVSRDSSLPEEIHRFLFAESVDGIFITDPQGRFMAVNPRGTELTGYPREELLGLTVADLIPPEDLSRKPLRLDELRQGKIVVQERRFRRKDDGVGGTTGWRRGPRFQLLITDVVMPEMNGRDLAKLIGDSLPGLRCLFISGYTANAIAHRGVLEEGVYFLQKPFSLKDLASKVRRALDRG